MSPAEKIWWTKVIASIGVAWLTLAFQLYFNLSDIVSLMAGVIIYLLLSDVLSSFMGVERLRSLKIGVGVYFFTWLTAWILLNTYLRASV
jgi:hypothetical protein